MEKLEQKILNKIKSDEFLDSIIDDEIILELARDGIGKALFEDRIVRDGYNKNVFNSPVIEASREAAMKASKKMLDTIIGDLMENEKFRNVLIETFVSAIPDVMKDIWRNHFDSMLNMNMSAIKSIIKDNYDPR